MIRAARDTSGRRPIPSLPGGARRAFLLLLLLTLPLAALAPGHHPAVGAAAPAAAVRNGRIEVDGQPFFPFGFYYVSWHESDAQMLATLNIMAAAGFNTVHASLATEHDRDLFLDEAERLGIRVIAEGVPPGEVPRYRANRALLGWNIGDDVHDKMTPQALADRHAAFKAADPDHLTYFTVYNWDLWGPYLDKGDLVAPYNYPISGTRLGEVDHAAGLARQSGRPLIGVPQAFAWPGDRPPTAAEVRNMAYQYLVNGALGLIAYNYSEQGPLPVTNPGLWAAYAALVPELAALAPALTSGTFVKLGTGVAELAAAQWWYGDRAYVVVVNTDVGAARTVALPGATGVAVPLFAGRPAALRVEGGQLVGTLAPQEVAVYTLDAPLSFPDLAAGDPAREAVTGLAARGIVKGYADGRFGVADPALRAQMAALLARAMGWGAEGPGTPFTDRGGVDDELWRAVGTLAARGVARGYPGGTFDPTGPVLQAQAVSFVTRAMVARGLWQPQPENPALYGGVLAGTGHAQDAATYWHYTRAQGGIPDYPEGGGFAAWDGVSTRGWFARVLWTALQSAP